MPLNTDQSLEAEEIDKYAVNSSELTFIIIIMKFLQLS